MVLLMMLYLEDPRKERVMDVKEQQYILKNYPRYKDAAANSW